MSKKYCLSCGVELTIFSKYDEGLFRPKYCGRCEAVRIDARSKKYLHEKKNGPHKCDIPNQMPCFCGQERIVLKKVKCDGCEKEYKVYLPKCLDCLEKFWDCMKTPVELRESVRALCVSKNLKT